MSKIIGIDHGSVRIGIAVSDDGSTVAFGREAIQGKDAVKAISYIKKLAAEENASIIVIGYPLNLKAEKTKQTGEVELFQEKLKEEFLKEPVYDIKIVRWDERFTSKMALDSQLESGMKKKRRQDKSNLDITSAAIMLQSYLDSLKRIT